MSLSTLRWNTRGYHPWRKIRIVAAGMRHAILNDFSVAYKLILSAILLVVAFVFREWVDFLLLLTATGLVLVAEILNTAIETLCDIVEPRQDARIKAVKDVAAAAVGIAILVWMLVLAIEAGRLLTSLST